MDYLSKTYLDDQFMKLLNDDICVIESIKTIFDTTCSNQFLGTMTYGFKAVVVRYFELIRYLGIKYYQDSNYDFINASEFKDISNVS
jgi:hypothetical protein